MRGAVAITSELVPNFKIIINFLTFNLIYFKLVGILLITAALVVPQIALGS